MNRLKTLLLGFAVVAFFAAPAAAQIAIDSTTLSSNLSATATNVTIGSVTCTSCGTIPTSNYVIYIDSEALCVTGAYGNSTSTTLPVTRGCLGTVAAAHVTSKLGVNTVVFFGPSVRFHQGSVSFPGSGDPPLGSCTRSANQYLPWINVSNGIEWVCDNVNWRALVNYNVNGTAPSR